MHEDPPLPPVFSRAEALAAGATRHQVDHRVRTGRWRVLRRGLYCVAERFDALPAREQHLLAAVAVLRAREDAVVSHVTAALAYGWALPMDLPDRRTVTTGDLEQPTRQEADLVVQVATLPDGDVTTRGVSAGGTRWELRTTSRARTVADNLRHLLLPDAVALGDSALREGRVGYEQVARVIERQELWPYAANGRRALQLLDPRRESWLESWSFVTLHSLGLPLPEPQVLVHDARGRLVGRVDGWLEDEAVVLEPDGRAKYLLDADGGSPGPDAAADELAERVRRRLLSEKDREDRLRDLGAEVVRWGTAAVRRSPREVLGRIEAARRRGDRSRFTGRTTYQPTPPWLVPPRRLGA